MGFDHTLALFYEAGRRYSDNVRPYALHLFLALFVIDITVSYVMFVADGQLDPAHFLGRLFRHVLGGGLTLAFILHGWAWLILVLQSFSRIGSVITGGAVTALSPDAVFQVGNQISSTLANTPTGTGIVSSLELAIICGVMVIIIWAAFLAAAIELLLTLAQAYLTFSLGVILLAFGGTRFTAPFAEGYFSNAVRIGVKVLLITAVLAVALQLSNEWETAVNAACNPTTAAVPWITSYSTSPTSIMTTVCTGHISLQNMLGFAAKALVFALCVIAIPRMTSNLVGGTIGHAIEDIASAMYISRAVAGAVSKALHGVFKPVAAAGGAMVSNPSTWIGSPATQEFAAQQAAKAKAQQATSNAPTTALNPYSDATKPPGYNLRGAQQQTTLINPNGKLTSAATTSPTARKTTVLP